MLQILNKHLSKPRVTFAPSHYYPGSKCPVTSDKFYFSEIKFSIWKSRGYTDSREFAYKSRAIICSRSMQMNTNPMLSTRGEVYVPRTPTSPTPSGGSRSRGRMTTGGRQSSNPGRYKAWMFTLNNYVQSDMLALDALFSNDVVEYLVYGKEVAPTTGTPHLQGLVVFKVRKSLIGVRDHLPRRCSGIEAMGGTYSQAADYCRKEGDFKEFVNLC